MTWLNAFRDVLPAPGLEVIRNPNRRTPVLHPLVFYYRQPRKLQPRKGERSEPRPLDRRLSGSLSNREVEVLREGMRAKGGGELHDRIHEPRIEPELAAELLGISESLVREWMRKGRLTESRVRDEPDGPFRIGIPAGDIARLLASGHGEDEADTRVAMNSTAVERTPSKRVMIAVKDFTYRDSLGNFVRITAGQTRTLRGSEAYEKFPAAFVELS
jgi:hypothetical protein